MNQQDALETLLHATPEEFELLFKRSPQSLMRLRDRVDHTDMDIHVREHPDDAH